MTNLFRAAAPLRARFGVEPFYSALRINRSGEAFIHELCHIVTLERRGLRVPLRPSLRTKAYTSNSLSERIGKAIKKLSQKAQVANECETLAVEVLLLELNGYLDIRNDPEKLGVFLKDIWVSQSYDLRVRVFRWNFKKFVLRILTLRDEDWIRDAAKKVRRRVRYWRAA
jgi:hypothetical protein